MSEIKLAEYATQFKIIYCCICGWWHKDDGRDDTTTTKCPECSHKAVNLQKGTQEFLYKVLKGRKE